MAKVPFNSCVNVLITKLTLNKYKLYLQVVMLGCGLVKGWWGREANGVYLILHIYDL